MEAFLALEMLFRKGGTSSSILAVALLVAILASMSAVINHINSQADALSKFVDIGGAYLILSKNSISITDGEVDVKLARSISDVVNTKYVLPQKIFAATLATKSGNHTTVVRGIEDVQTFLNIRNAYVKGAVASSNETKANVGEVLARQASINVDDEVSVTVNGRAIKVKVVGIVKTLTQSDIELIIPMRVANQLSQTDGKVSFIEFAPKDYLLEDEVNGHIIKLLPANMKVVKVQQLKTFIQDMNSQTLSFLGLWSSAVYAVVVAASYVVATRLVTEANYDLAMLRALGSKRKLLFTLVVTYTTTVGLLGSILGLAIGITGTQMASTAARCLWPSIEITPFLEVGQALQILLLTLASSILGCTYPAFKSSFKAYMEQPL